MTLSLRTWTLLKAVGEDYGLADMFPPELPSHRTEPDLLPDDSSSIPETSDAVAD